MQEQKTERTEQAHSEREICCPIVELRQYTLHPGQRDVLIDLFDREFVETQEAVGMRIIGQFRDLDDPNRFVWLRGFSDIPSRGQALASFYGGTVWKAHRDAANATMIDSSNALLLRPAHSASGFSLESSDRRPAYGAGQAPRGLVIANVYYFDAPVGADFVDFFERSLKPELSDAGASILGYFVTDSSENNFPALPLREENVFVWFSGFSDLAAYERHVAALARSERWMGEISAALAGRLKGSPEIRKLSPTTRSQLHG